MIIFQIINNQIDSNNINKIDYNSANNIDDNYTKTR